MDFMEGVRDFRVVGDPLAHIHEGSNTQFHMYTTLYCCLCSLFSIACLPFQQHALKEIT